MDIRHPHALTAALAALLGFGSTEAGAQQRVVQGGGPITPLSHGGHFRGSQIVPLSNGGHFGTGVHNGQVRRGHVRRGHGFPGFLIVERPVPVIVERVVEVPAPPPFAAANGPPPRSGEDKPRKPYVVGASYASLPGGCMKMIEGGASYYYCGGGEWYRLVGSGRYKAVARP